MRSGPPCCSLSTRAHCPSTPRSARGRTAAPPRSAPRRHRSFSNRSGLSAPRRAPPADGSHERQARVCESETRMCTPSEKDAGKGRELEPRNERVAEVLHDDRESRHRAHERYYRMIDTPPRHVALNDKMPPPCKKTNEVAAMLSFSVSLSPSPPPLLLQARTSILHWGPNKECC